MSTFDAALLVLRVGVGAIFAVHGAQKLFGWWSGPGFAGWRGAMASMGYRPAPLFAGLSALAEFGGGLLLAIGFLTPLAATLLVAQSLVIIGAAHWQRGFFNGNGGYEFPLALGTGVVAILIAGPGAWSVDAAIRFAMAPEGRFVLLGIGVVGGLVTLLVPRLGAPRQATEA